MSFQEQFSAAAKAQLEAQIALFSSLASKTFESVEKIVDLNLNVVKASLDESNATAQQLLTARDPQEFLAFSAAQAQPTAEKALAYGRHLQSIASSAQADFTRAAENQISEANRKVLAQVEEFSKNAPPGSENVVAFFKSAIGNANAGYEQLSKTTKQAVETMEGNINNAVGQFAQAAEKTTVAAASARQKK